MLYTKHKRFNLLNRLLVFLCIPVLFLTIVSTLVFSGRAYAANKYSPEQMAAAWNAGMAFAACTDSSGYDGVQTAEDINKGGVFDVGNTPGADSKTVGYLVEPDDGSIDCETPADVLKIFDAIGEKTPLDFLKSIGLYKLNGDKTAYEVKLSDPDGAKAFKDAVASKFGFTYASKMPKDLQYAALNATFVKKCRASEDSGGIAVKIVDAAGAVTTKNYVLKGGQNDVTEVGFSLDNDGGNDGKMSCPTIVNGMNSFADDYSKTVVANVADANPANDPGSNGSATGLSGNSPSCEANGDPLTWIMCPIFNGVASFSDWMFRNMVEPLLRVSPVSTDPDNGSFQVWSNFRIYGNIILIISMLVIVFGQTIGGGVIDAYTAKKVMPRILVAAILVNLSVYLIAIAVDVTNIIGGGVGQLLTAPFKDASMFQFSPNASQAISIIGLTGAGGIGAFLAGVIFPGILSAGASFLALFVLLPAVLGILGAFVTLIIRQGLLLLLIMVSPVAFALYCLPNTEKYFKKWFELLVKTLVVYPIVILIFAGADILSVTVMKANDFGNGPLLTQVPANTLAAIVAFVAQFLPLVMIPWAFKFAGGAIGQVYQNLSGIGKKTTEAIKGNANDQNSLRNKTRRNLFEGMTEGQGAVAQRGRKMADDIAAGKVANNRWNRRTARRGAFADMFGNVDQRLATYNKQAAERRAALSDTGLDDLVFAGAGYEAKDGEEYFEYDDDSKEVVRKVNGTGKSVFVNSKGKVIGEQTYRKGKSLYGGSVATVGQGMGYTLGKAQNDGYRAAVRYSMGRNAQAEGWDQTQLNSAWAAATYPLKGQQATEWYSKPKLEADGSVSYADVSNDTGSFRGWLGDVHQTRQGFQLTQMTDGDWRMLQGRQQELEAKVLGGTASQQEATDLARVYEVYDAASQKLLAGGAEPGTAESSAAGATAASKPHIEAAIRQRQLKLSDQDAAGNRTLYTGDPATGAVPRAIVQTTGDIGRNTVREASIIPPKP